MARARRADEWVLEDGQLVRLASVVVPDEPAAMEARAREMLTVFVAGKPKLVELVELGGRDRYGRRLATFLGDNGEDARSLLLRAGLAVVRMGDEQGEQVKKLLSDEAMARAAGLGIWGELDQARASAESAGGRIGRFAYVEGVVQSVTPRRDTTFVDFGQEWRTDFTVRIRREDLSRFAAAGIDLTALAGRKVIARGWPFLASGPMLEARDPLELQPVP